MLDEYSNEEIKSESGGSAFSFDRRIVVIALRKRIKYIVFVTFIAMILAGVWAKVRYSPVWRANCFVIRAPKNMSTPVEMPYLYQTFDINTILETVRTRDVLTEVIKRLNLDVSPEGLYRSIDVQRGNRSNVLKFSASWTSRDMSAKIANTTAESFIMNNTMLLNSATEKIHNYYQTQQQNRLQTIETLELQYEQHRAKYGVISIPHETQAKFDQLKEVELKMIENSLRFTEMDTKITEMGDKLKDVPDEVVRNWTYTQTDDKKLLQLEKELETLKTKYTVENPKVLKILKEIDELKKTMKSSERDLPEAVTWGPSGLTETYTIDKTRFEAERQATKKMNDEYQLKVTTLKTSLENLTQIQKEFFEIERQLQLNRDILRIVESRLAEAKMAMQSNVSDYEILEKATPPSFPEGTKRKLLVLAVGMFVFGLGTLWVVGREIFDPTIKSEKDIIDAIKIPLIGHIPDDGDVDKKVYFRNFQVLVDNIVRLGGDKKQHRISFGADIPDAWASFLIKDIINMLVGQNKKILYIDSIPNVLPDTAPYLINDWIYHQAQSCNIDKSNPSTHYAYFLADDSIFQSVSDQTRIIALFDALSEYDYIFWELFDCHYNVQLFSSIASATDMLVLVGRFKRSSKNSMANIVHFLKERGFNRIYGVLNYVPKDYYNEKF